MARNPGLAPAASVFPVTVNPGCVTMGRNRPVCRNFNISAATPAPFCTYPYVTGRRRITANDDGGSGNCDDKMLGFCTGSAQSQGYPK